MARIERGGIVSTLAITLAAMVFAPVALADDEDDVRAFIQRYGELEDDLDAQSRLIRDDRVMITTIRQSDNAQNMAIQKANRAHGEAINGGPTRFMTSIEGVQVKIFGDVAVASFVRTFNVLPHNQPPTGGNPQWVTLVLVKEGGDWGITHTHNSPAGGN